MANYEPNSETAPTHEELDLEDILKKTVNIEEDFKVGEILPRVLEALFEHTKYTTDDGVERYKSDFSESSKEDLDKIADSIFDSLVYHSHLLHFDGMGTEKYEALKDIKDAHGNSYVDQVTQSLFGISRDILRQFISNNKKNLETQGIVGLMNQSITQYIKKIRDPLLGKIENKHLGYVKDFVGHKKLKHDLGGEQYNLTEVHETGDHLYEKLKRIAEDLYKKD